MAHDCHHKRRRPRKAVSLVAMANRPLAEKLTPEQQAARQTKIAARRTVAEHLTARIAHIIPVVNVHTNILTRGFFGRLKWLVFGK